MWPFNDLDDPVYIKNHKKSQNYFLPSLRQSKIKMSESRAALSWSVSISIFLQIIMVSLVRPFFFSVPGFQWSWWYVFMVLPNSDQSKFVVPPEENQHQFQNARGPNFGSQLSEIIFYFEKNRKFWEHLEENYWLARARKASSQKLTNLEFGLSHFAIFLTKIW